MIQFILFLLLSVSTFTYNMEFKDAYVQAEDAYSPARNNNFTYNNRDPLEVLFYDQIFIDNTLYTLTYDAKNDRSIFAQWDISYINASKTHHFINNCSLVRQGHFQHISYDPTTKMFTLDTQEDEHTLPFSKPTGNSLGRHDDRELTPAEYNTWFLPHVKKPNSIVILLTDDNNLNEHYEQDEDSEEITGLTARIPWSKVGIVTIGIAAIYGIYKFATKKKMNSDNEDSPIITITTEKIS